jgi:GDP-L-fucose synthase
MNLPNETYVKLLASDRNDGLPPLLNLGSGVDLTIGELAHLVKQVIGFDGGIEFDVSKPDGTMKKLMDSARLNKTGWSVTTSLKAGLEQAYQDFKRHESLK